jgi:hypothetical protein
MDKWKTFLIILISLLFITSQWYFLANSGLLKVRVGGPRGQDKLRSPRGQARHHRRHPQR